MTAFFVPLREILLDGFVPSNFFGLPEGDALDVVGITGYRLRSLPRGVHFAADLGVDPTSNADPALVLELPLFPDLAVVLRTLGRLEVRLQEDFALRLEVGAFSLRLPRALLKPVRANAEGGWEPDPDREHVELQLAYRPDDGITSPNPLVVTVDKTGRLDLDTPFLDLDGAVIRPRASLNGRAMIADTGIVIDVQGASFNLDPEDPWLAFDEAEIILPAALTGLLVLPQISLTNARLSRRGVSGTATVSWPLDFVDGEFVYQVGGPEKADLFGLNGGLRQIAVSLEDNRLVAFEINGGLLVPYFKEPVDVRLDIQPSGDFTVTLLGLDADGLTLRKPELLALTVKSLTVARRGDVGEVVLSGGLEPLLMASDGLIWPRLEVTDLAIDTEGRFRIREAWIDLKELATLDLFGFHFELSRIGLGYENERDRDRLWLDLSGSLRLIEQIPVGLGVEGFRLSWPRDLDVSISTPPTLDDSLAILSELEVQFDGIYLFFGVPDAVEFEGLIRFIKTDEVVGFAGDVALRVPACGFAAEAGLMVGMNFEPPPYPFLYVYFGVELPAGIPLGPSGLALKRAQGLFGLNVSPAKTPEENWYYDWYKRPPIVGAHPTNKWQPERSALAFGAGLTITTADGYLKGTRGLLVLSLPGPILIIEGRALLLSGLGPDEPPLRALAVFDGEQQTVQFNVEARAELVEDMLEASGGLEAYFDFKDITNWHVYLGQDEPADRRIQAKVFKFPDSDRYLFDANGFLMVDTVGAGTLRSRMGVYVGLKQQFKYDPIQVDLDAEIDGAGLVTVNPEQFSGELDLDASVKISAFGFGFQLGAHAGVMSEGPDPFRVEATVSVSADLPDPLEDIEVELKFAWESPTVPEVDFPLVGAVVDSDFLPKDGALGLHGVVLREDGGSVLARLADEEGRLGESDAQREAERSPVAPLDARPTFLFAHDMNDETAAQFARDGAGDLVFYTVGRIQLRPSLREVALYSHPRSQPWTGDFTADWKLVASSASDAIASDDQRLWGVWLADAAPESDAPAARRLRLWTTNPFTYAQRSLGTGYPRILGLRRPPAIYAEQFLEDYPEFQECRGTKTAETCLDFADAPKLPKHKPPKDKSPDDKAPDAKPHIKPESVEPSSFVHGGVIFVGDTWLESDDYGEGPCLAARDTLDMRFPEPVFGLRLVFCRDPQRSTAAARDLVTAQRVARTPQERKHEVVALPGSPPGLSPCVIPVPLDVAAAGATWTLGSDEGFDCVTIRPPAPIESLCFVTVAERDRAARARAQCERNADVLSNFDDPPRVLEPGTYYRLIMKTTVDIERQDAADSSPFALALDELYGAALKALTGSDGPGTTGFLQEAFFRTEGPPRALAPYVKWSSPPSQATRVFRDDDLAIRFRRPTLRAMFSQAPHRLGAVVRDATGLRTPGYETRWKQAPSATLLPDEQAWIEHSETEVSPPPDDVLVVRRELLFAEDFDDGALRNWEVVDSLDSHGRGSPWRVAGGELHCEQALFGGALDPRELAKPGPMLVIAPTVRASGPDPTLVLSVELRSDAGEAIGVIVGYVDPQTYYRVSLDDQHTSRRLVKVVAGTPKLLFETTEGFDSDRSHEVEITFGPAAGGGLRLRVRLDGRAWCDVLDQDPSTPSERFGLYCWRNAHAHFPRVRVRSAAAAASSLAPGTRYELAIVDIADDAVLHRVPFVTSAYRRFRDLVQTFSGSTLDVPATVAPAAASQSVRDAMAAYADASRAFERGAGDYRGQRISRADFERLKTNLQGPTVGLREARAALDAEFQVLASALAISLFDPPADALEIRTLRTAPASDGSLVGFWLRSPETLDLRYFGANAHVGRTIMTLHHRTSAVAAWVEVPMTLVSDADGLQVLLLAVPSATGASSAWGAGRYRTTFVYYRNHGDEMSDTERPYDRPVERHLGSDALEQESVEWLVS